MKIAKCLGWAIAIILVSAAIGGCAGYLFDAGSAGDGIFIAGFFGFATAWALAPLSTRYLF